MLLEKDVVRATCDKAFLPGMHRVLFIDAESDQVVVIPVTANGKGWLTRVSFSRLKGDLNPSEGTPLLRIVQLKAPPAHGLSPEDAIARYPRRRQDTRSKESEADGEGPWSFSAAWPEGGAEMREPATGEVAALIAARDRCGLQINSLFNLPDGKQRSRKDVFSPGFIAGWIADQERCTGRRLKSQLYKLLRRFFMWGETPGALTPEFAACGAKGKCRKPRSPNTRLGRKNPLFKRKETPYPGFSLAGDEDEKERIRAFAAGKSAADGPVALWYREYLGSFYAKEIRVEDGEEKITLEEPHLMPTEDQFRDCITSDREGGERKVTAPWIKRLAPLEFEQEHSARFGSARDKTSRLGELATMDLTSGDVQLRAISNRRIPTGIGSRMPVIDVHTGFTLGVHDFYGTHRPRESLLALYNAATSKEELGKRLNLPFLNDRNFPPIIPNGVLVDHDEWFTQEGKDAAKSAGFNLVFPEPRMGIGKPTAESDHRSEHARTAHRMAGTTLGRKRKFGEPDRKKDACWNIIEVARASWRSRYYRNCKEGLPAERVPVPLRAEFPDRVFTRLDVVNWMLENGYSICSRPDPTKLVRFLLPTYAAKATPEGIFLLRADQGNSGAYVRGIKYEYPLDFYGRWFGGPVKRPLDLPVRAHPYALASAWFIDPDYGLIALTARWDDPTLINYSLYDLLQLQCDGHLASLRHRPQSISTEVNWTMQMIADDLTARAARREAEAGSNTSTADQQGELGGIKEAQEADTERLNALVDPVYSRQPRSIGTAGANPPTSHKPAPSVSANPIRSRLRNIINGPAVKAEE